jgi:hypothetical protein
VSEVDTRFHPEVRATLLEDVRSWLPAFLSSAATQQHDPQEMSESCLASNRLICDGSLVHLCLSALVQQFIGALADGLRRPMTSTERPPTVSQAVRGDLLAQRQGHLAHRLDEAHVVGTIKAPRPRVDALPSSRRRVEVRAGRMVRVARS